MLCESLFVDMTSRWRVENCQVSEGGCFRASERRSVPFISGALPFPKVVQSLAGGYFRPLHKTVVPRRSDSLFQIFLRGERLFIQTPFLQKLKPIAVLNDLGLDLGASNVILQSVFRWARTLQQFSNLRYTSLKLASFLCDGVRTELSGTRQTIQLPFGVPQFPCPIRIDGKSELIRRVFVVPRSPWCIFLRQKVPRNFRCRFAPLRRRCRNILRDAHQEIERGKRLRANANDRGGSAPRLGCFSALIIRRLAIAQANQWTF